MLRRLVDLWSSRSLRTVKTLGVARWKWSNESKPSDCFWIYDVIIVGGDVRWPGNVGTYRGVKEKGQRTLWLKTEGWSPQNCETEDMAGWLALLLHVLGMSHWFGLIKRQNSGTVYRSWTN